jgi:hypothetical protein
VVVKTDKPFPLEELRTRLMGGAAGIKVPQARTSQGHYPRRQTWRKKQRNKKRGR